MLQLNSTIKKSVVSSLFFYSTKDTEKLRSVLKLLERMNKKSDQVRDSIILIKNELEYSMQGVKETC